jgi:diketogulonate reductase-like aldo/keto reductase
MNPMSANASCGLRSTSGTSRHRLLPLRNPPLVSEDPARLDCHDHVVRLRERMISVCDATQSISNHQRAILATCYNFGMTTTAAGDKLSALGIGTFGIGGRGHRDVVLTELKVDKAYLDALSYTFHKGFNFAEISLGYGHGNAIRIFKSALDADSIDRGKLFLTHSIYPRDLESIQTITEDTDAFYKILGTGYADSTLVTQSVIIKFGEDEIFKYLNRLLKRQQTRYVSLSNASPDWIRRFKKEFGDKFFAHEGHLSFEVRELQDKGVFKTCKELDVENIIWRPLLRSLTLEKNWLVLTELATKYQKTQSQIILNWMHHYAYRPMVFSTNLAHIEENYESTKFLMADEDYKTINQSRPKDYSQHKIDWEGASLDDDIVALTKLP